MTTGSVVSPFTAQSKCLVTNTSWEQESQGSDAMKHSKLASKLLGKQHRKKDRKDHVFGRPRRRLSQSFVSLTHTRDKKSRGGSCDVSCLAIPAIYLSLCQCVCLLLLWSVFTNCQEKSLLDSGVKSDVVMRERFGVSFFKGAVTQVWRRQKWTVCSLSSTREAGECPVSIAWFHFRRAIVHFTIIYGLLLLMKKNRKKEENEWMKREKKLTLFFSPDFAFFQDDDDVLLFSLLDMQVVSLYTPFVVVFVR